MKHALEILLAVDRHLASPVELTLYGRAAFALGIDPPPPDADASIDVDVVLWVGQAEQLLASSNLWEAIERANRELAPSNLHISHFFEEGQVILRPDWRAHRVHLEGPWVNLRLYRLADEDLWLSKMMRDDPQDRADAEFLVARNRWTSAFLKGLVARARVPNVVEIEEQFRLCTRRFLSP